MAKINIDEMAKNLELIAENAKEPTVDEMIMATAKPIVDNLPKVLQSMLIEKIEQERPRIIDALQSAMAVLPLYTGPPKTTSTIYIGISNTIYIRRVFRRAYDLKRGNES